MREYLSSVSKTPKALDLTNKEVARGEHRKKFEGEDLKNNINIDNYSLYLY